MRHTDQNRKNGRRAVLLLGLGAAAACAGGEPLEAAPVARADAGASAAAPNARANPARLRSAGYDAPDMGDAPGTSPAPYRSIAYADLPPVRQEASYEPAQVQPQPQPRAQASDAVPAPKRATSPYFTEADPSAPSVVPPAPRAGYDAPRRAALPDLDQIVVTDERAPQMPVPGTPTETSAKPPARYASAEAAQRFEGTTRSVMDDADRPSSAPAPAPAPASPAPAPAYEPVAVAEAPIGAGGYALHLASYRMADQASEGWSVLTQEHAELSRLTPRRARIDLPEQGAFVRLIAGPFGTDADAADACAVLEARGSYCAVVPFGGTPL